MPFCQLPMCMGMPCVSGVHRRVVEGSGVGSPGCVVFFSFMCMETELCCGQLQCSCY